MHTCALLLAMLHFVLWWGRPLIKNSRSTKNPCPTPPQCILNHLQSLNTMETIHSCADWSSLTCCCFLSIYWRGRLMPFTQLLVDMVQSLDNVREIVAKLLALLWDSKFVWWYTICSPHMTSL